MRIVMILALCLVLAVPATADDTMDEIVAGRNGKKALLFSLSGLYLSAFEGGIGMKWWMSGSTAFVGNVLFSSRVREAEVGEERYGEKSTNLSSGVAIGVEKHMTHFGRFSPYLGANIGYRYTYRSRESEPPSGDLQEVRYSKEYSNTVSVGLLFGVECFVTKNLSVGGQYELAAEFSSGEEEWWGEKQDTSEHRLGIGTSYVALAIYF